MVPMGDYNNKKIIVGRRTTSTTPYFNYVAPTETYVDITENVVDSEDTFSILANGSTGMKLIYQWVGQNKGFDRLGVKANFKTLLSGLNPITGNYGLYLKVTSCDDIVPEDKTITNLWLGQAEMYGNVYNFNTFFAQEGVYDISALGTITNIDVYLYQLKDFKSKIASQPDEEDEYIAHTNIVKIGDKIINEEELEDNIFVNGLYISFGYDLDNFTEDRVIVYTLDSIEYSSENSASERNRILKARWVHKEDDGSIVAISSENELDKYDAKLYWHHYKLQKEVSSVYGGQYWELLDNNNNFDCQVNCSTDVQDEYYKAIIVLPSKERIDATRSLLADINSGDLVAAMDVQKLIELLEDFPQDLNNDTVAIEIDNLLSDQDGKQESWIRTLQEFQMLWETYPVYDIYLDILNIHNTSMVQANLAVDLVQAITINVGDEDGRNGVFNIYGDDGQILNQTYSIARHKLVLNYNSLLTGARNFDGNGSEIITWKFPLKNSMIKAPTLDIEYSLTLNGFLEDVLDVNGEPIPIYEEIGDYAYIRRVIVADDSTATIGDFLCRTTEQIFRIKDYYNAGGNNTIYCTVEKNGYTYTSSITLVFGMAGSNGTNYTFKLIPGETAETGNDLTIIPAVYDCNNKEVVINNIEYGWYQKSIGQDINDIIKDENSNNCKIRIDDRSNTTAHKFNILVGNTTIFEISSRLTTYLPIPWSKDLNKYNHFEGPDRIIYDAQGIKPSFYKGNLKLYDKLDREVKDVEWSIELENGDLTEEAKFYPSILKTINPETNIEDYVLKVPSMFLKQNSNCAIIGRVGDEDVWYQPLLIMQNRFGSSVLNDWNEDVIIDEENGIILSPMIGAGKKNTDNSFSGVLLGDVNKAIDNSTKETKLTGVYGYDHGVQSFSLTEDGAAIFGAAGKGQISIDGQKGIIQSGNYTLDDKTGMKINLEDGSIDAYNFRLRSKYITLDSSPGVNNYFTIKGSGYVKEINTRDAYDNDGLLKRDGNGTIVGLEEEEVLKEDKILVNVGNSSFYLQTLNYDNITGNGLKLDLTEGKLIAYDGFTLKATNRMVKVKDDEVEDTNIPIHYIKVIEKVKEDGLTYESVHTPITAINVNNYKNYYFKSGEEYLNEWDKVEDLKLYEKIENFIFPENYEEYLKDYYYKFDKDLDDNDNGNYRKFTKKYFDDIIKKDDEENTEKTKKKIDVYRIKISGTYKGDGNKQISLTNNIIYKKETTSRYVIIYPIDKSTIPANAYSPDIDINKKYCYIDGNKRISIVTYRQSNDFNGEYYYVGKNAHLYYWKEAINDTDSIAGSYEQFYDGRSLTVINASNMKEIYTNSGEYKKGVLTIDAAANEYPIKLQLGNETPFKLSWAGLLSTSKLNATGGTIGGWKIDQSSLRADNDRIVLVRNGSVTLDLPGNNGFSSTNTSNVPYTGPHILVGPRNGVYKDIIYSDLNGGIVTEHSEGSYINEDVGKYKKQADGKYKRIKQITAPYYEQTYNGDGGIYLLGNGTVVIENLRIKGGAGTWGGCASFADFANSANYADSANYASYANSANSANYASESKYSQSTAHHTHSLSGKVSHSVDVPGGMTLKDKYNGIYALNSYTVTINAQVSGDSDNPVITISTNTEKAYSSGTYYIKDRYWEGYYAGLKAGSK